MGWRDAPAADQQSASPKWASAPAVEEQHAPSMGNQLKRQLGLTARLPIDAIAALPLLAANAGVASRNAITGSNYDLPSQMYEDAMSRVFPTPESGVEKGVNIVGSAIAGARLPVPSIKGGAPPAAPAVTRTGAPAQAGARSAAEAQAAASVSPGEAAAESVMRIAPEMRVSGGGSSFGTVGDDASAGLNSTMRGVMDRGREIGMRVTPGQATGSRALQQLEAKLESQPMTSGPFNAIRANNASVVNRSAAASIGETSDVVDDAVLSRAVERIGQVYDDVADETPRTIEPRQFLEFYAGLQDETRGLVQGLGNHPLVEDAVRFAKDGAATGRQLQSLGSKLGKAAYKNMSTPSGDRDLGMALYRVKDYVDDLLRQGLDPERVATFDAARQQYRNLMLLTQRTGVVNPASGDVSGRNLANVLQSKDRAGYLLGGNRSPMYESARFAKAFAPIVGDSGTATRMPIQSATDLLMRVPASLATRAYTSSPAVSLALRTQAASQAAARAGSQASQRMGQALMSQGNAGASATGIGTMSRDEQRRRALAAALARQGIILEQGQ